MTVQTLTTPSPLLGFPTTDELVAIEQLVERYSRSNLVPAAIRGKGPDVFTVLTVARDLGLPATSGLFKVHVVDGRPTLAADLMVALLLNHGHDVWPGNGKDGEEPCNGDTATYYGKRRGTDRVVSVTYTLAEAQAAGLTNKDNWKKNPAAMLRARASSALCRILAPDVLGGIAASVEELQDESATTVAVPAEPVDTATAAERLKAVATPPCDEDGVVDAEVVPDEQPPATPENSIAAAYLGDVSTAETLEALQDIWRNAQADGVLDDVADGTATLRELLTAKSDEIKAQAQ